MPCSQSAPLVMMHTDNQHYDAQCFLSVGDLVLGLLERVNADGSAGRELPVLDRMARLTALGQSYGESDQTKTVHYDQISDKK